jgi:hypothetical protein
MLARKLCSLKKNYSTVGVKGEENLHCRGCNTFPMQQAVNQLCLYSKTQKASWFTANTEVM